VSDEQVYHTDGSGFISFNSLEEMLEWQAARHEEAMARLTAEQKAMCTRPDEIYWFRLWPEPHQDIAIFGHFLSHADYTATIEEKIRQEPEDAEEWRMEIAMRAEKQHNGYLFGEAYSMVAPEGELGSTHVAQVIGITETMFAQAQMCGWSLDMLARTFPDTYRTIARRWNEMAAEQAAIVEKNEGGDTHE
jgi:hypothetical protein